MSTSEICTASGHTNRSLLSIRSTRALLIEGEWRLIDAVEERSGIKRWASEDYRMQVLMNLAAGDAQW